MAFLTGFILRIKKNKAIKLYLRKLPHLLQKDYGKSKRYRPKQVRATIERSGLPLEFSCYAIAIFCSKKAFENYHTEMGETCDYEAMRSYVGNLFFSGNTHFSAHEVSPSSTDFDGGFHGIDTGGSD